MTAPAPPWQVDFDRIVRARRAIAPHVRRTPIWKSDWLSGVTGGEVFLKVESLQVTGSFKIRGAIAALAGMSPEQRALGITTCSTGNHGLAVVHASRLFEVPCNIVVPRGVSPEKERRIRASGANLIVAPAPGYDDAEIWTRNHLAELGGEFLSPFEHPDVMAGNGGSLGCEIFEELEHLDAVVVPCGGGGLGVGLGSAARILSPATRILGVNSEASPGMWLSRREGKARLRIESRPTLADGIEGGVGEISFALGLEAIAEMLLVSEAAVAEGIRQVLRREKVLVEGAAAVPVAAALEQKLPPGRICLVLTGSNIAVETLEELLAPGTSRPLEG
jgi:threonine dehydratase